MAELVYILTNPRMPDIIKIGRTTNIKRRLNSLSKHSGVPVAFECYCCYKVDKKKNVEKLLHKIFNDSRVNDRREFFEISPDNAQIVLEQLAIKEVFIEDYSVGSKEEQTALKKATKKYPRQSPFNFSEVGIRKGSTLTFSGNQKITAEVIGNRRIMFDGEETSLSPATTKAFAKMGKDLKNSPQGPMYWKYKGELLTKIRDEKIPKEKANKNSPSGYFLIHGIRKGSKLIFTNDENIIATAIENDKVKFNGEVLSLTAAATKAFAKIGKEKRSLRGPMYWKYKGKRLTDI